MDLVEQLDFVPSGSGVLGELRGALDAHKKSVKAGGDRIFVKVEGSMLELESAVVRETGDDFSDKLTHINYYLVTSAELVEGEEALGGE
jgi:hypothetical protein